MWAVVNMAYQLRGDEKLLGFVMDRCDVAGLVEARKRDNTPLPVSKIVNGAKGLAGKFRIRQNTSDSARSGSAVVVAEDADHIRLRWSRLFMVSTAGGMRTFVQARYLRATKVLDNGLPTYMGVVHFPLESTGLQGKALRRTRRWVARQRRMNRRWILMGDGNTDPVALARTLGAGWVHHVDVMFIMGGGGWGAMQKDVLRHPATDHGIPVVHEYR